MWFNLTFLQIDPARVKEFEETIYSEGTMAKFRRAKAKYGYLLQLKEHPEQVISLTAWDSEVDASTFLKTADYAGIVAELRPFMTGRPEAKGYEVLREGTA